MTNIEILRGYYSKGYSFFNTGSNEKKVLTRWTDYQTEKPSLTKIKEWIDSPIQNWAIVCGEISNIIVFDVDTKNGADPTPFQNLGMYEICTPSGGYHFYCKYHPLLESTKHKRQDNDTILKSVDVQSNGSIVFAPPTKFPNGEYTIVNDVPVGDIPEDLLKQVIEALKPKLETYEHKEYNPPSLLRTPSGRMPSMKPGDIFNQLMDWEELLQRAGWKPSGRHGDISKWTRPGKEDHSLSATLNWGGHDIFYVFTSSDPFLEGSRGYTKFSFYTLIWHNGNYHEASKAVRDINYKLIHNRE